MLSIRLDDLTRAVRRVALDNDQLEDAAVEIYLQHLVDHVADGVRLFVHRHHDAQPIDSSGAGDPADAALHAVDSHFAVPTARSG
jgi:hypothetical protein